MTNTNNQEKVTLNAEVTTTSVTQTANQVLGTAEKQLYYLVIKNEKGEQEIINVGLKTHNKLIKLTRKATEITTSVSEKKEVKVA